MYFARYEDSIVGTLGNCLVTVKERTGNVQGILTTLRRSKEPRFEMLSCTLVRIINPSRPARGERREKII